MHNRLNLKSSWHEVKERLKENDIDLSDEDLEYEPGKEEELLKRLEIKMNKSRGEIIQYIESISANESKAG
ncbi:MAG: general stress protein CsbD [Chitinophagaceae bacterium]|nr:general stress protein CsbD [Chitinophagaceae bacterium]